MNNKLFYKLSNLVLFILFALFSLSHSTLYAGTTVYNANWESLNFNGTGTSGADNNFWNIIGNGKNDGDVVRFNHVITIDGQAIDAVVTTSLNNANVSTFDSTSNPSKVSEYFQPLLSVTSAGGGATFNIDFYKGGTYIGEGTGIAVTLHNIVINSYDIDGAGSRYTDRQYQDFKGFRQYELAESTYLVPEVLADGSVRFQYTASSGVNSTKLTSDEYRIRVYYDSIVSFNG